MQRKIIHLFVSATCSVDSVVMHTPFYINAANLEVHGCLKVLISIFFAKPK